MARFDVLCGLAVVSLLVVGRVAVAADPPPPSQGEVLYKQNCAACHDHPKDRIPAKDIIAKRTPEEVVTALTTGSMRVQAGGLNLNEQNALATYLTADGQPAGTTGKEPVSRRRAPRALHLIRGPMEWLGSGSRQLPLPAEPRTRREGSSEAQTQMGLRLSRLFDLWAAHGRRRPRVRHQRDRSRVLARRGHGLHPLDV
jgi:cbb3-type cytochrome c oxidase subunit III